MLALPSEPSIPRGYRFLPTKEEVLLFYLRPAVNGERLPCDVVVKADIYGENKEPWKLFDKECEDSIWILTKLKKKKKSTLRIDRTAGCGCWLNRNTKDIKDSRGKLLGSDRYFIFSCKQDGRDSSQGNNGTWIMHEYSLSEDSSDYVICEIKNKDAEVGAATARDKKRKNEGSSVDERMPMMKKVRVDDHELDSGSTSGINYEQNNGELGYQENPNTMMDQTMVISCSSQENRDETPGQTEFINGYVPFNFTDNEVMDLGDFAYALDWKDVEIEDMAAPATNKDICANVCHGGGIPTSYEVNSEELYHREKQSPSNSLQGPQGNMKEPCG